MSRVNDTASLSCVAGDMSTAGGGAQKTERAAARAGPAAGAQRVHEGPTSR